MRSSFHGSIVALPTPFQDGAVDFRRFGALIERQIAAGSHGLVVAGTTGEAATLEEGERAALFAYAVGIAQRRVPVLAGVGTNATRSTLRLAQRAEEAGADGLLVVTPYYNRPTQAGLELHFRTVAEATRLPVVLYNVPARTGVDLAAATALTLARHHPNVVAIKEASGAARVAELARAGVIDVLCGEDAWIADAMHAGARGVVGVVANVVPERVVALLDALERKDEPRAAREVEALAPLVRALFLESNPGPLKHALAALGLCGEELRPPLVPVGAEAGSEIGRALAALR